jgi:tetratricopeptide (TPR) repeat protein
MHTSGPSAARLTPTRASHLLPALAVLLTLVVGLTGCNAQRPLYQVREAAQEHENYGRDEQALADYQEYVDRNKTNLQARLDLSRLLVRFERYRQASMHMEIAYSLGSNRDEVVEQYAETMFLADNPDVLLLRLGERAETQSTVDAYLLLAHWADRVGDTDQRRRALLSAERLGEGKRLEPYLELAKLAARVGDDATEIMRLKQALYIDLNDGDDIIHPQIRRRLREHGLVVGPTIAIPPR